MAKKTQTERLQIAEKYVAEVYEEVMNGHAETNLLQTAAYIQMDVDRLVWKLNLLNNKGGSNVL